MNNPRKAENLDKLTHLDLFSGIGGFAYAADQVWDNVEHTFCEIDPFCKQVLKKHWPESEIYDDIRTLTNTGRQYGQSGSSQSSPGETPQRSATTEKAKRFGGLDLLTGGFPCQPFSAAGLRRGTADERHLWPEMLRVIRSFQPQWVIAENVRGLLSWDDGVVFEQVCADLEESGYEVQAFVIPAVAVNAPHRRDRVWFIGHAKHPRRDGSQDGESTYQRGDDNEARTNELEQPTRSDSLWQGLSPSWNTDWHEVAAELCRVDDGLSAELDGLKLSKPQHRKERLKSLGNAIVPQVAIEIMKGLQA